MLYYFEVFKVNENLEEARFCWNSKYHSKFKEICYIKNISKRFYNDYFINGTKPDDYIIVTFTNKLIIE